MKTASKTIITLTAMVLILIASATANPTTTRWAGGMHFNSGLLQGDLKDQIGNDAYGLDGQIFYTPKTKPFAIGLDLSWMNYGSETRREPFSTTIPDVTVDVTTSNSIVQALFVLRRRVPAGRVQLYGDALVGLNYLYTRTNISNTGGEIENIAGHTNQDDAAFAYGIGGGALLSLYTRNVKKVFRSPLQILLDAGVRYVRGGEAEYLKEGSIQRDDGNVTFETMKSRTDMVKVYAGVLVRF